MMKKKYSLFLLLMSNITLGHVNYWDDIDQINLTTMQQAQKLLDEKKYDQALGWYKKELSKSPQSFEAHLAMGKIYEATGQYIDALDSFTQAMNYRPTDTTRVLHLGNCLLNLGNHFFNNHDTQNALKTFNTIFTISPDIAAVHHNIAFTLAEQTGDFDTAIEHYKKALAINPDHTEAQFCFALSLLAAGDLIQGFKYYESRWKRNEHAPRSFQYPLEHQWDGQQSLEGKRIVINVEQGLGDTLQFIRYAQLLKAQGATVIAETQKPLAQILSLCPYLDEIVPVGKPLPQFDFQIPMINLPIAFKTTVQTIPANVPYLRADPRLVVEWRQNLCADRNFKIGICWRGDGAHGTSKFMPLNYFARLAQMPGVSVYSLQKDDPLSSQKTTDQAHDTKIIQCNADFDNQNGRFMDTAAMMKNLDLVITVDTSIAHLAGGLGVPTWLVTPFPAEWRWLTERTDSPWYPTMRLFRQKEHGNWDSVFFELLEALSDKVVA
ncbi:MAG: tetratricopeptide repeat-containing glycosyltransferase family protein [Candidatus Babeliales bacterium]|nr:tetratricopeptide repeat-containing glycosyltransferase family protein [Candidatus Babeliales bacterium]